MSPISRLSCEEVFRRLDDFLDRELSADEMQMVQTHLDVCAQCANEFDFERRTLDAVREKLQRIEAPADLRRRIARAIDKAGQDGPAE